MPRSTKPRSRIKASRFVRLPVLEAFEPRLPLGDTLGGPLLAGLIRGRLHASFAGGLFGPADMHGVSLTDTFAHAMRHQREALTSLAGEGRAELGLGEVGTPQGLEQFLSQATAEKAADSVTHQPTPELFSVSFGRDVAGDPLAFDWLAAPWGAWPRAGQPTGTSDAGTQTTATGDDGGPLLTSEGLPGEDTRGTVRPGAALGADSTGTDPAVLAILASLVTFGEGTGPSTSSDPGTPSQGVD